MCSFIDAGFRPSTVGHPQAIGIDCTNIGASVVAIGASIKLFHQQQELGRSPCPCIPHLTDSTGHRVH